MADVDPTRLAAWERILASDVAVALLLLGAVLALWGSLLAVAVYLWRENRALHREFRDHLKAQAELQPVLRTVRQILELQEERVDPVAE